MPENIAQLLSIVRILLEYARHLAATLERRAAAPGFVMFEKLFGTARRPVMHGHLHRGILRATALETMLLKRAATGHDVAISNPSPSACAPETPADPAAASIAVQLECLLADRAQQDAPIDPARLPTLEEIEAEVAGRPIGRTIADISRDLGIIAGLCTCAFWNALLLAMIRYAASDVNCHNNAAVLSEPVYNEQSNNPAPQPENQGTNPPVPLHRATNASTPHEPNLKICRAPVYRLCSLAAPHTHPDYIPHKKHNAVPAFATGPPRRAAMKIAA